CGMWRAYKMARKAAKTAKQHAFRNKLVLNHWLISLFGVDPLVDQQVNGKSVRPFHRLAEPIRDARLEGLDNDNLHYFYHYLGNSPLLSQQGSSTDTTGFRISREMLLAYEQNIVKHTQAINERRKRLVVWKYFQWLALLFVEVYLDRYFAN